MREHQEWAGRTDEAEEFAPGSVEAPDADVADQRREVFEEALAEIAPDLPLEADPADVADQQRIVPGLDEELP